MIATHFSGESIMTSHRLPSVQRVNTLGAVAAAASLLLLASCASHEQSTTSSTEQLTTADLFRTLPPPAGVAPPPMDQAEPIPGDVLITGSLTRGGGPISPYPPPAIPLRREGAPARVAPPPAPPPPPALAAPRAYQDVYQQAPNAETYPYAQPNSVKLTAQEPVSTFSVDVDTAAYANVRRFLNDGRLPPADAVRVEEMINYFDYGYALPRERHTPFGTTLAVYPSPWNSETQILHVGIKGFDLPRRERPRANLVFLIDTSGSMSTPDKLPLLKRSFHMLVDQLRAEDRISIVTYAGSAGIVLDSASGSEKARILDAIDRLQASGSTAGGEGIRLAYALAKRNFDGTAVNRVLLATDGDFNVGITDPNALEAFVAHERASGVFLTVLGFGSGNYKDLMMQKLAQAGNGTAGYVDSMNEARKVFVGELSSTLFTIAKDVKIQVEFNPARVAAYRLIGYETRQLNRRDFNNDRVDAGDIGAGHSVTALYEITPAAPPADPLRYRDEPGSSIVLADEIGFVKMRYKLPSEEESRLITRAIDDRDVVADFASVPMDMRFAAAVAGAGQLLRRDPYVRGFDFRHVIAIAQAARGEDPFGHRAEFVQLMRIAESATGLSSLEDSRYSGW
jgi:Ca-activated chloride channel family protein